MLLKFCNTVRTSSTILLPIFHPQRAHPPPCFWRRFQLDRSVCRQALSFLPKNLDEATCRESLGLEGTSWEPKNKRSAAPAGPPSKLRPSQMWEIWALHFWGAEKKKKNHPAEWQNTQSRDSLTKLALLEGTQKVEGQKEREKERQEGRKSNASSAVPVDWVWWGSACSSFTPIVSQGGLFVSLDCSLLYKSLLKCYCMNLGTVEMEMYSSITHYCRIMEMKRNNGMINKLSGFLCLNKLKTL